MLHVREGDKLRNHRVAGYRAGYELNATGGAGTTAGEAALPGPGAGAGNVGGRRLILMKRGTRSHESAND